MRNSINTNTEFQKGVNNKKKIESLTLSTNENIGKKYSIPLLQFTVVVYQRTPAEQR